MPKGESSDSNGHNPYTSIEITKVVGSGTFGTVYKAAVPETNEIVAVKKVLQDRKFKNRELEIVIMLSKGAHPNVLELKHHFYTDGDSGHKDEVYLNLVMAYMPCDLSRIINHYARTNRCVPMQYTKLYMYQLARANLYVHSFGVCHRDIKPQNVLVDPETNIVQMCDMGSAKVLRPGEPNISYISSRFYRAPELIFDSTNYTTSIDVWSYACVFAEMLLGEPLFRGESSTDQLIEIITVLGTPSKKEIQAMNPDQADFKYRKVKAYPLEKVFGARATPEAIELLDKLLQYAPNKRLTPIETLAHPFFNELRREDFSLPNGVKLPPMFNFTAAESRVDPVAVKKLVPKHIDSG